MTPRQARAALPALFPEGVVAGRFAITRVLGVGGTGTVFEAEDQLTGQSVALKAIPQDPTLEKRARRELRVAKTLDHPAIVKLLETVEDDDYIYVIFELVRGDDLAGAFRASKLNEVEMLRAVAGVCDALAHAHERGVVHRDVKPGNVLLRDDGMLKLTDFGVAQVDHPDATIDDRILGTLSYMAPEQVRGDAITGAADVWASALMLYEALTGENPYRAQTPRELADRHEAVSLSLSERRPDLPPAVCKVVDRALLSDPRKRPDAARLRDALLAGARQLERRGMDGTATHALPLDREPEPARPLRGLRRRLAIRRELPALRLPHPGMTPLGTRFRRLRAGIRREAGPRLRLVPAPVVAPAVASEGALEGALEAPAAPRRAAGAWAAGLRFELPAAERLARLKRSSSSLGAGVCAAALLTAAPFYPLWLALVAALIVGALALARPLTAVALTVALTLPIAGNLAGGLVPAVALAGGAWLVVAAAAPRRAFLPALAPVTALVFAWPIYLLCATTARRPIARAASGFLGPFAIAVAWGLAGATSPLTGTVPGASLAGSVAGDPASLHGLSALGAAIGTATPAQAVAWALLALGARPLVWLHEARLRSYAALWLGACAILTILAPLVVGAPAGPVWPIVGACAVAGILLGAWSARARLAGPQTPASEA